VAGGSLEEAELRRLAAHDLFVAPMMRWSTIPAARTLIGYALAVIDRQQTAITAGPWCPAVAPAGDDQ
jgi:hypothetical protein